MAVTKKATKKKTALKKVALRKTAKNLSPKKITATRAQQKDAKVCAKAVQQAMTDPVFRKKFIKQPRAVLGAMRGKKLDPKVKVKVHEDTDRIRNIVIPFTGLNIEEISIQELEILTVRNTALQICVQIG